MSVIIVSLVNYDQTIDSVTLPAYDTQTRAGSTITSDMTAAIALKHLQAAVVEDAIDEVNGETITESLDEYLGGTEWRDPDAIVDSITLTDASAVNIDASLGTDFQLTAISGVGSARTITVSNAVNGWDGTLWFKQAASGGPYTLTMGAGISAQGTAAYSEAAGAVDVIGLSKRAISSNVLAAVPQAPAGGGVTVPTMTWAVANADPDKIVGTPSIPLYTGSVSSHTDFTGTKAAAAWNPTACAIVGGNVELTMPSAAEFEQAILLTYAQGANRLLSRTNNQPVAAFSAASVTNNVEESGLAPLSAANIFAAGHSLLNSDVVAPLVDIATSLGFDGDWERQNTPGAPIRVLTGWPSEAYAGYSSGDNRTGSGLDVRAEFITPTTVTGPYNVLMITENHTLLGNLQYNDTIPALKHYVDQFIAGNASGEAYLWHCWLGGVNSSTLSAWIAQTEAAEYVWESITSAVNRQIATTVRTDRVKNIPAATALAQLATAVVANTVAGITGGSAANAVTALFDDDTHLTDVGLYYMSCIGYTFVYRRSPVGGDYPGAVSGTAAASLQALAWDFYSGYTAAVPTAAQSRAHLADTYCDIYHTYRDEAGQIATCESYYGSNTAGRPFSDTPQDWWPDDVVVTRLGPSSVADDTAGIYANTIGFASGSGTGYYMQFGHCSLAHDEEDGPRLRPLIKITDISNRPAGDIVGMTLLMTHSEAAYNDPPATAYGYRLLQSWRAHSDETHNQAAGLYTATWNQRRDDGYGFDPYPWGEPGASEVGVDRAATASFSFPLGAQAVGDLERIAIPESEWADIDAGTHLGWVVIGADGVTGGVFIKFGNHRSSGAGETEEPALDALPGGAEAYRCDVEVLTVPA